VPLEDRKWQYDNMSWQIFFQNDYTMRDTHGKILFIVKSYRARIYRIISILIIIFSTYKYT